ncbi:MAG TPA: flavodoxin family protein [Candidatus Avidesulfovibrio excrementigallinarum]|nr:flavodoxin family protein [Candidatus Avidesulfovibrio excrementigallinarum]
MSSVVVITGSLRKNSNSVALAEAFAAAARDKGLEVTMIDAARLDIGPCHACNSCYSAGKACVFDDDFNKVAEALTAAEGIVVACPVYWYTFPAKVKALLDKLYALYAGGRLFTGKRCALISCCADDGMDTFDGINIAFDKSFELMGAQIVGRVEIPGVQEPGDIRKTDGEAQAAGLAGLFA